MTIKTVRRLAADIMNVGLSRVKIHPEKVKEADKAVTRADVKNLISGKVITKAEVKGRKKNVKKKRKGHGSRKGGWKARVGDKEVWMAKVRSQRKLLTALLDEGVLEPKEKRKLYVRIKGGLFKSKRAFIAYLKDAGLISSDYELKAKSKKVKTSKAKTSKAKKTKPKEKGDK
jgi:large subunit ribosomal protein L19e